MNRQTWCFQNTKADQGFDGKPYAANGGYTYL